MNREAVSNDCAIQTANGALFLSKTITTHAPVLMAILAVMMALAIEIIVKQPGDGIDMRPSVEINLNPVTPAKLEPVTNDLALLLAPGIVYITKTITTYAVPLLPIQSVCKFMGNTGSIILVQTLALKDATRIVDILLHLQASLPRNRAPSLDKKHDYVISTAIGKPKSQRLAQHVPATNTTIPPQTHVPTILHAVPGNRSQARPPPLMEDATIVQRGGIKPLPATAARALVAKAGAKHIVLPAGIYRAVQMATQGLV
jgi:hypothetical protein